MFKSCCLEAQSRRPGGDWPETFTNFRLSKAVYANGWDGPIVIYADTDGRMQVVTGVQE